MEWISCKDRLPEDVWNKLQGDDIPYVLAFDGSEPVFGRVNSGQWEVYDLVNVDYYSQENAWGPSIEAITHWMPLPAPPEDKGE